MNEELKTILEEMRNLSDKLAGIKNKHYAELYSKNEMANYSEIQQSLNLTTARTARFIEHLESNG